MAFTQLIFVKPNGLEFELTVVNEAVDKTIADYEAKDFLLVANTPQMAGTVTYVEDSVFTGYFKQVITTGYYIEDTSNPGNYLPTHDPINNLDGYDGYGDY